MNKPEKFKSKEDVYAAIHGEDSEDDKENYQISIKSCPHCGSNGGFYVERSCNGISREHIGFDNIMCDSDYDIMDYDIPRDILCINCKKSLSEWIKV